MSYVINVSICDGKYTIIQDASGSTRVLRYGEPWRWVTGDNVILGCAYEIDKLQDCIKQLEDNRIEAATNSLANKLAYEDAVAKIKRLENHIEKLKECITGKWIWMMDYCKKKGTSPTLGWEEAETEWYKLAKEAKP